MVKANMTVQVDQQTSAGDSNDLSERSKLQSVVLGRDGIDGFPKISGPRTVTDGRRLTGVVPTPSTGNGRRLLIMLSRLKTIIVENAVRALFYF